MCVTAQLPNCLSPETARKRLTIGMLKKEMPVHSEHGMATIGIPVLVATRTRRDCHYRD